MTRRSWRDFSPAEIDAGLERQQERQQARYDAGQDRLDAEVEFLESIRPEEDEEAA